MQTIKTPPRTMMEVFRSLPEGTLAELIDGNLYISPAPTPKHQRIIRRLTIAISSFVDNSNLGEIFMAPCDVFLDEHSNAVQPDIIFISKEKKSIIKEDAIHGIPEILIEILSPSTKDHGLIRKKELYEKFGVTEYWVVTPETKETVGFFLNDGKYSESGRYVGKIHCVLLDNTEFAF